MTPVGAAKRIGLAKAVTTLCALYQAASANPTLVQQQREVMAQVAAVVNAQRNVYVHPQGSVAPWGGVALAAGPLSACPCEWPVLVVVWCV